MQSFSQPANLEYRRQRLAAQPAQVASHPADDAPTVTYAPGWAVYLCGIVSTLCLVLVLVVSAPNVAALLFEALVTWGRR